MYNISFYSNTQYQNTKNNLNFKGKVGKNLCKYIERCADRECENYFELNSKLESNAMKDACVKIHEKWNRLLEELSKKMSKEHKDSVLDYAWRHCGDMDGWEEERIIFRNSTIKGEAIQRTLAGHSDFEGYKSGTPYAKDPNFGGYYEAILDKNGKCFYYNELWLDDREKCVEKYPSDVIYDNIKDFVQKTNDTTLAEYYRDNTVKQQEPLSLLERFLFRRKMKKINSFWQEIGYNNFTK